MNTPLSNLYAELAMSRVQLDEDEFILDLISKQLNQISERGSRHRPDKAAA